MNEKTYIEVFDEKSPKVKQLYWRRFKQGER